MSQQKIRFALIYDFDGTLAEGNMQERNFIPKIGMGTDDFWREVTQLAEENNADSILMYMFSMLKKAEQNDITVRAEDFRSFAEGLKYFPGLEGNNNWFDRINQYGAEQDVEVEHYVVSSGIKEMIEGTPLSKEFAEIFACSFHYDPYGKAIGPAVAVNYTGKTQFLFRINKGCHDVYDQTGINQVVPMHERPVPFEHMVYIGDGDTDVPSFRLVKDMGGHSIAVHSPQEKPEKAQQLLKDNRVNAIAPADYSSDQKLEHITQRLIDKVVADAHVRDALASD